MSGPAAETPLKDGKTNPSHGSTVKAELHPEPMLFYRPETNEILVVSKEQITAFNKEIRLLDQLMYDSVTAKDNCLKATDALLHAQRLAATQPASLKPAQLEQAEQIQDKANKELEEKHKKLEEAFKPFGKLDDTGGKLYELIPIQKQKVEKPGARTDAQRDGHTWAKKWTYVRSNQVKSHFRSYQLNDAEQEKHQGNKEKSCLDANNKIDTAKLKKQFATLESSAKWKKEVEIHGVFLKSVNESIHSSLDEWAAGLNRNALGIKIEPEFQLMRYFAGAGVEASWNPSKGNVAVRADARAEFVIAEGRFKASCYWPGQAGLLLKFTGPKTQKIYDMGLIRCGVELEVFGMAGASASAQLGITVDYTDIVKGRAGMRGRPAAAVTRNQVVDVTKKLQDGADVSAGVDLFAGARASGSIKGQLQWNSPEDKQFMALCEIGPGGQVQAGAGLTASFKITLVNGKFRFLMAASACLGVGAGGKLEFEVNVGKTLEFSKYVAHMLYSVGYEYTELFLQDSYMLLTNLTVWAVKEGKDIEHAVEDYIKNCDMIYSIFMKSIITDFKKESVRINLMNRVLAAPNKLDYATPEAKGILLYQLTRHNTESVAGAAAISANTDAKDLKPWAVEFEGRRKRAVSIVCKKARSKAEFRNIMQHMTANGSSSTTTWHDNFIQVKAFLDRVADRLHYAGDFNDYYNGLAENAVLSGQGLAIMYAQLYDEPVLGYAFVDNDTPDYMARAEQGHDPGYLMAGGFNPEPRQPRFPESEPPTEYA